GAPVAVHVRWGGPRGIRIVTPARHPAGFPSTSADMPASIGTITTSYACGPGVTAAPGANVTRTAWNPPRSAMMVRAILSVDCVGGACTSAVRASAMNIIEHHNLFTGSERDPLLRRIERDAVLACAAMALAAAALAPARLSAAAGVAGGGALAWISYLGIKGGIDALVGAAETRGNPSRNVAIGLVKVFTRYGILAAVAYVIM